MAVTRQSFGAAMVSLALAAGIFALPVPGARAATALTTGSVSGLPLPRFVSLKADRVNVHRGPGRDQEVSWVYTRAGMPVEITAEFENWRRIRDWQGAEGWVYHSMLSGKRTAVVVPTLKDEPVPIYDSADAKAGVVAKLQGGVLGALKGCSGSWCEIAGTGFEGWIKQDRLWGAYPNEKVD